MVQACADWTKLIPATLQSLVGIPFVLGNSAPVDSAARPVPIRRENCTDPGHRTGRSSVSMPGQAEDFAGLFEDPPD